MIALLISPKRDMTQKIKILILEDEIIVAKNMDIMLSKNGYYICGVASNYDDAKNMYEIDQPDIVISDIRIKGQKTGVDFVQEVVANSITPVIFITSYSDEETLKFVSQVKSFGYITKPFTKEQLLAVVSIAANRVEAARLDVPSELTKREFQVVQKIVLGLSTREIAEELEITHNTVESHRKNIFTKLKLQSSVELVTLAFQRGWIN